MNESYMNKGLFVDNSLNVNALNITGSSVFGGTVSAKTMVNIEGNTSIDTNLKVKDSSQFAQGFTSNSSLNLNNNTITNISNSASGTNLANKNSLKAYDPIFFSYQSQSGDSWLEPGDSWPWISSIPANYTNYTPNYTNQFVFQGTDLVLSAGLYSISLYIFKRGGLGNGFGGHLELFYTNAVGVKQTLGWAFMWNEGGQNFPGAIVDITFPVETTGSVNLTLVDNGYFIVQYFSVQVIYYPLFSNSVSF